MLLLCYFLTSRPSVRLLVLPHAHFIQYLLMVAFVWACGAQPSSEDSTIPKPDTRYEAELQPLVEAYEADATRAHAPVAADFRKQLIQVVWEADLGKQNGETVLGRCERLNENHPDPELRFRIVKIRKPDAKGYVGSIKLDDLTLKTVVYHELGHCLHDFRGHLPEATHQIMSSVLPKERFQSFQKLLQEHFSLLKTAQNH